MLTEQQRSEIRACCRDEACFQTVMEILTSCQQSLESAKSDFLSVVGHELRTPLTAIQGSLALLAKEVPGPLPEKAKQMIEIAIDNSMRLRDLVNYFLDIQALESGRAELKRQPLELEPLIRRAVGNLIPFVERRQIEIRIEESEGPVCVIGDEGRLLQVIGNLLSNAVKFSPSPGRVTVFIGRRGDAGYFAVADQGPGIPEHMQPRLFDKFSRDTLDERRGSKSGTGLGLSICKAIVERLEGRIGFTTSPERGTVFRVELPLCPER